MFVGKPDGGGLHGSLLRKRARCSALWQDLSRDADLLEQADFDSSTGSPKKTTITLNMIEMAMGCVGGGGIVGGGGKTNGGTVP